jgi:hypothetical protein
MHSIVNTFGSVNFLPFSRPMQLKTIAMHYEMKMSSYYPQHRIELFKKIPLYTLHQIWYNFKMELKALTKRTTFCIALTI